MLPIVYHPDYRITVRGRFPMSKYGYLRETLEQCGLLSPGRFLAPGPLTRGQLALAHDPAYVEAVFTGRLGAEGERRLGLEMTAQLARRARLASGGTLLAAWLALEHGLACNTAGGSHHAFRNGGAGFCVFNDVAVAIVNLRAQGVAGPFLVVDADVHQGDGTAEIFADDSEVFTLSIHAARNYPTDKMRSRIDVALDDGTSDDAYLQALDTALKQALQSVSPALAFYNAGVDVHREDKLGRLSLSDNGLRARDRLVMSTLRARGIPVVGVLGGGYSDRPQDLAVRHAVLFEEAAELARVS